MRICVLGSGSNGNCTYLAAENTCVLVDAGFSPRTLERRLQQVELDLDSIDAVLLTHGHTDHTRGILPLVTEKGIPVYMTEGTRGEVPGLQTLDKWEVFDVTCPFPIGKFWVKAFPVPHDAAQPVGFRFSAGGISGSLATDLGQINQSVSQHLENCDWLIVESNHDEEMLKIGPYPWFLKHRLLSNVGHLSNQSLSRFLSSLGTQPKHLYLAHLSRRNNCPELAFECASGALSIQQPLGTRLETCQLHLTHQDKPSIVIEL